MRGQGRLKGYDSDAWVAARGAVVVIPPRANRVEPRQYDRVVGQERNRVEWCVGLLRPCRRVVTRWEKTARTVLGTITLAAISVWLRSP